MMFKKIFALGFFGLLLGLFEACFCGDYLPYYDYQKLQIFYGPYVAGTDTSQTFYITLDSVEYLASNYQLTLTPSAFGTSCPSPGEMGSKYAVTNFEIFADQDFNDTLTAGQSLSSIFFSKSALNNNQNVLQTLLEFPNAPDLVSLIYTPYLPSDTSRIFNITMRMTKENGAVAEGEVSGVIFR